MNLCRSLELSDKPNSKAFVHSHFIFSEATIKSQTYDRQQRSTSWVSSAVCYNSLIRSSKRLSFNVSFSRQLFTVLVYKEKKYFSQNSRTWIMSFQVLQTHPYITDTRRINCINEWKWKVQTQRLITIKFKFMALQKSSDWHTQHFTLLSLYSCFAAPRHFTGHFSETVSCVYWIHRGLFIPSMAYLEVKKKNVGHGK